MLFYGVITYIVVVVIFNLPFLMEKHHFSSGNSGLMISLFFLAITAPGFCLDKIVALLKGRTQKATMALAFVMMMNYLAILLYPFIVDFFQWIFHTQSQEFPFIFNLLITIVTLFWAYRRRNTFLFNDQLK